MIGLLGFLGRKRLNKNDDLLVSSGMNNTTIVADGELVLTDLNLLFSSGVFRLIFSFGFLILSEKECKSMF